MNRDDNGRPPAPVAHAWAYRALLRANTALNLAPPRLGLGYWSFERFLKSKVKEAPRFINDVACELGGEARRRGLDGVSCGHFHKAERRVIDGIIYIDDGDWVESCTPPWSSPTDHRDRRLGRAAGLVPARSARADAPAPTRAPARGEAVANAC